MRRSAGQGSARRRRTWLRRGHRWLGLVTVFFVLLLSVTGIALNHGSDWALDRRYIGWDWAIAALGIRAPEPSASFADRGHRVTQLGRRVYLDAVEIPYEADAIEGFVVLGPLAVLAMPDGVLLLTVDGDLVEHIDLATSLPGPVEAVGRTDGLPVLESGGRLFIADADVTTFEPWADGTAAPAGAPEDVTWSSASEPPAAEVAVLEDLYRGRGVTVERLLLEIHSGRIIGKAGPLLLDLVAVFLVALSLSGLLVWFRGGRGNGREGRHGRKDRGR